MNPDYPIYIPTRGRFRTPLTIRQLQLDCIPFLAVVVPSEVSAYEDVCDRDRLCVLPSDSYTVMDARNWIMDHAIANGHARHWQLDDNMSHFMRLYKGKRIPCHAGIALHACEILTSQFVNIGLSGLDYDMFSGLAKMNIFYNINCHVYSCTLVNNAIPLRWRLLRNEDTDMCLQVLALGWNILQMKEFAVKKTQTMKLRGGNTDQLYQGDGRLKMSRSLERLWPGIVQTKRRWNRPQHYVNWHKFKRKLVPALNANPNAYNDFLATINLKARKSLKSQRLIALLSNYQKGHAKASS